MAGPRWDDFGLLLRRAGLLVLCCHSQVPQLGSWLLLSSCGIWTPWDRVFSLEPPPAMWHGLTGSLPSPLPSCAGLRRAVVFPFLWGHCRASVLTGGDELIILEVFDHPHWVKLDVYSEVYPLLTHESFITGTTFFKPAVENLTRDYRIMGLSL